MAGELEVEKSVSFFNYQHSFYPLPPPLLGLDLTVEEIKPDRETRWARQTKCYPRRTRVSH